MSWRTIPQWLHRRQRALGLVTLALFGVVGLAAGAQGQSFTETTAQTSWYSSMLVAVAAALGYVLQLVIFVIGHLTLVLTKIFVWAVTYSDFIYNGTVTIGWEIVRDFCNMFFVVAILAIAWATILQLESYGVRRLLAKLVLMAILINFSKLITGVVIDLGQIVILTFAQATIGGLNVQQLFAKLGVGDLTSFQQQINESDLAGQAFSLLGTLLFATLLLFVVFGIILAYTLIFTFRIVALWILTILSPLAFLFAAFPVGSSYSRQWWGALTKYVFSGCVIMFFFWLALVTSERAFTLLSPTFTDVTASELQTLGVAGSRMGSPINLSRFIITACFLIAGLIAAQKAGVAGSDFAGDLLNRGRRAVSDTGRWLAGRPSSLGAWAARKVKAGEVPFGIGRVTKGLDLNVANWVRGFKESRAEKKFREEAIGKYYSGEALHKGGIRGAIKGLGAGRDFFDAYAKGFLNVQGFKRLAGSLTGGERVVEKVFHQVEREKHEEARLRAEADEKAALVERKDFLAEGVDQYVDEELARKGPASRLADVRARRQPAQGQTVSDTEKRYRKEFLKSHGMDEGKDKDEIERIASLSDTDTEYKVHFGSKQWKDFVDEKDTDIARKELVAEAKAMSVSGTDPEKDDLKARGRRRIEQEVERAKAEKTSLGAGYLAGEALTKRKGEVKELLDELKRIETAISSAKPGESTTALEEKKREVEGKLGRVAKWDSQAQKWEVDAHPGSEQARRKNFEKYQEFDAKAGQTWADSTYGKAVARVERLEERLKAADYTPQQREKLHEEAEALRKQADASRARQTELQAKAGRKEAPKAFYADEGYAALLREQSSKIHGENADELVSAFKSAMRDGDRIKASAIALKLAKDSNDNELWNAFGYDSDSNGKHKFINEIMVGKMGMSQQEAYALENQIDYINESIGHWETARTMKVEGGIFKQMNEEEHALNALAEIMKKNPREVARAFNRLAYGGEHVTNPATGEREFMGPSALGKGIIMALGPEIWKQGLDRGEYNKNAVVNLGKWMQKHDGPSELRRHNVDERYIRKLDEIYALESARGTTGAADTIAKLFRQLI